MIKDKKSNSGSIHFHVAFYVFDYLCKDVLIGENPKNIVF